MYCELRRPRQRREKKGGGADASGDEYAREARRAARIEARHVEFLGRAAAALRERTERGQAARRLHEAYVKRRAVAFHRKVGNANQHLGHTAELLGIAPPCLASWLRAWEESRLVPIRRGRPPNLSADTVRDDALELLEYTGPAIGVNSLLYMMPELGRNEAQDLLYEYREACRADLQVQVTALQWMRPGTVWAMDHTEPPAPIDGRYPVVFVVRDLASHCQLAALPQTAANDRQVAAALTALFTQHGAPLVLKSDNHVAFTGRRVRKTLAKWGVLALFSPRYLPRYNGSAEAGVGHIKVRTHILAAHRNRPGRWTADDLEAARLQGNRLLLPWGTGGPTPEEQWNARRPITQEERDHLHRRRERLLADYRKDPPIDFHTKSEYRPVFRVIERDGGTGRARAWTRRWNERRPAGRASRMEEASRVPYEYDEELTQQLAALEAEEAKETERAGNVRGNSGEKGARKSGQTKERGVYYERLLRRSLSDAMVALGILVIRKRRIPLPIKRVMRLKIA